MKLRNIPATAMAGYAFALGGGEAMAQPQCSTITTIGAWQAADSCDIGDKNWDFVSTSLPGTVQVLFQLTGDTYSMQIIGFDQSAAANAWGLNYVISVTTAGNFISDMFAGADNPGGGSLLSKNVTPNNDPFFNLLVVNGVENAAAEKHGLDSKSVAVSETFSVNANATLLSVSDTFVQSQTQTQIPEPASLLLLATGLVGMGWFSRRRRGFRA